MSKTPVAYRTADGTVRMITADEDFWVTTEEARALRDQLNAMDLGDEPTQRTTLED